MTHDTIILDGLDVEITYTIAKADPDVGIFSDYPTDWYISRVCNRKCPDDLDKALRDFLTSKEEDILLESLPLSEDF